MSIVEQAEGNRWIRSKLPNGYEIVTLRDQSIEIKDSVYSMLREAMLGCGHGGYCDVVFFKKYSFNNYCCYFDSVIDSCFLYSMHMLGYTLNIMTLAGIAVAVGRVVDDSIVVIENVFRRIRTSKERNERLVEEATREVANAHYIFDHYDRCCFLANGFCSWNCRGIL